MGGGARYPSLARAGRDTSVLVWGTSPPPMDGQTIVKTLPKNVKEKLNITFYNVKLDFSKIKYCSIDVFVFSYGTKEINMIYIFMSKDHLQCHSAFQCVMMS